MQKAPKLLFPFIAWLVNYKATWFRADLSASLTVALIGLPQGIAFATIAGLPPEYGIYASVIPAIIGSLYGSSHHLVTGPSNITAIIIYTTLVGLTIEPAMMGPAALLLALLVGIFQFSMGMARMGRLVDFISNAVIVGFTIGAAILIFISQLPAALGLQTSNLSAFHESIWFIVTNIHNISLWSLGITIGSVVGLIFLQKYKKLPGPLIILTLAGCLVAALKLQGDVATVGNLNFDIRELFTLPNFDLILAQKLVPSALALAILSLIMSASIAKSISMQSKQNLSNNREFIGQGLSNITAAFTHGMPVAGSFNRSALSFMSGARTAMSSVFAALIILILALAVGGLLKYLPLSSIAGMLFLSCIKMIDKEQLRLVMSATKGDALTVVVTLFSAVFLSLEFAIYIGVLLSICLYLARTGSPYIRALIPSKQGGVMIIDDRDEPCPQMGIMGVDGSVFFGSAEIVRTDLRRYLENHPEMQNLLLRLHAVDVIDASGVAALWDTYEILKERGGRLCLAGLSRQNTEVLTSSGLLQKIGPDFVRLHTTNAMKALFSTFSYKRCYHCPHRHFKECRRLKRKGQKLLTEENNKSKGSL